MAPNTKEAKSGEMMWHTPKENPKSSGTPLARSGHTIVAANEKAYLFGGCGIEEGQAAVFQDLWILQPRILELYRWLFLKHFHNKTTMHTLQPTCHS